MDTPRWVEQQVGVRLLRLHDAIYKRTNGRIGHRFIPGTPPNLLLHTIGAKTGRARSTSVVYFRDGDTYLIVASKGGDPRSPGWYYNLKASPDVEINLSPKRFGVTASRCCPATRAMPGCGVSSTRTSATITRLTSTERRGRSQCWY